MLEVQRLIAFDREVMTLAIDGVRSLHTHLKKTIHNEQHNGGRTLQILQDIRNNESLKPQFSLILNQAIVLLISYFGSAVQDTFCKAVNKRITKKEDSKLLKEEIKISISELVDATRYPELEIAEILIEKKDLSFQDMQSIQRAFKDYVQIEIEKDKIVNNIILAQGCRHVIVHAGGVVTTRLIRQVSGAVPRDIKPKLPNENEVVKFDEAEVNKIIESMNVYIGKLVQKLKLA
jgi:hypothetical protein